MSIVIVAIPQEDDPVWKYSSEKVPHMTLLYLGDNELRDEENTLKYIQHVAKTSLSTFGMSVSRRGPLGPNDADVLFFAKDWQNKDLVAVRGHMLANDNIKIAHDSAEQFEGWTPHLTMGFPESPAKKDDREYPGFHYVQFDRIAVWFDDYEGPEFLLEANDMLACDSSPSAAWSDEQAGEETIEHAGPTVQDILDALSPEERGTFDLVLGAAVDDIDLSGDAETVAAYDAFSDDQKNVLGFLTGLAVDMDIDDDLIDEDELAEEADLEEELRQSAIAELADDILMHYGVPGQKWGVRNDRSGGGSSKGSSSSTPKAPKPPKPTKINKLDSNTRLSRKMLRDKVKQGHATIGEAHKAAIKSKGHRVLNFVAGDRKYWVSQLKIAGVTAAVIGVAALGTATGVIPAAALGTVAVTTLAGTQGAALTTAVTNAGRAVLGNRRINKSYQNLGPKVNDLDRKGDDKIKKTLNKQGGTRKKFLEDKKKTDVDNPNVKHSSLEDLIGDILDPKVLEHSDDEDLRLIALDEFLMHYGVPGMRWGYRRSTNSSGLVTGKVPKEISDGGPGGSTASPRESADHDRAVTALAKKNEHGVQALSTQELKDINNRIKALDEFEKAMSPKEKSDLQRRVDELKLQRELRQLEGQMKLDNQSAGKTLAKSILANGGKVLADNVAREMGIFGGRYVDTLLGNSAAKAAEKDRERARDQANKEREERRQDIREELKQRRKEAREDDREYRKQRQKEEDARRQDAIRLNKDSDGTFR